MRLRSLLPCVAVAAALAGCGETGSSSATFEGEEAAVADVVEQLEVAGRRRDADAICKEILSRELVRELEEGGVRCVEELELAIKDADDTTLEVLDVTVDGDSATARVEGREGDSEQPATLEFVKESGAWRATSLALDSGGA